MKKDTTKAYNKKVDKLFAAIYKAIDKLEAEICKVEKTLNKITEE